MSIRVSSVRKLLSLPRTLGMYQDPSLCNCEYVLPRRDYTVMEEVVDRELWERCRKGRMTSRSMEPAPRKREVKEEGGGGYQEWKRRRREGERDSRDNDGRREKDPSDGRERDSRDRRERDSRDTSWRNEEYSWREREERPRGDRRREGNSRTTPSMEFKRETDRGYRERKGVEEKLGRSRLVKEERWGSSRQDTSHYSNDSGRGSADGHGGGPAYHDDGLEELGRSGDFTNWSTAVVKRDREERREEEVSTGFLPPTVERGEDEDIERLHK